MESRESCWRPRQGRFSGPLFRFVVIASASIGPIWLGTGCGAGSAERPRVQTTAAAVKAPPARCEAPRLTRPDGNAAGAGGRLQLFVLGSGDSATGGRAASGFVVIVDGKPRVLVDAGTGTFQRLEQSKLDTSALDLVLVTHLHRDHVDDLDEFLGARASKADPSHPAAIRVFGPAGEGRFASTRVFMERLVGRQDGVATRPGLAERLRMTTTDIERRDKPETIFRDADGRLVVHAISVDHGNVPTLAYRIQYGRRSIAFSGDLAERDDNLALLAHGVDLLVHEAAVLDPPARTTTRFVIPNGGKQGALARSAPDERSDDHLYERHAPPQRIGRIAARAPVGELLLTHLPTSVRLRESEVLDSIRGSFGGDVRLAEDCELVNVGPM